MVSSLEDKAFKEKQNETSVEDSGYEETIVNSADDYLLQKIVDYAIKKYILTKLVYNPWEKEGENAEDNLGEKRREAETE